jgi:methylase of polypeptide subunit release factors
MHPSKRIPNSAASEADYAALLHLFTSTGFHLDAIRQRLGISKLEQVEPLRDRLKDFGPVESSAQALIHLFVEGKPLWKLAIDATLGVEVKELLQRLNLIFDLDDQQVAATVALYPIEHIYIASDRYNSADESQFEGFDDIVYPCLFQTTARFLRMLSRRECGPVLDLCSGTAVAALLLARTSEHAYAADITERAWHFATFNQRMNGIRNATMVTGDLYEPVAGLTFDRIVVHPPYQPVYRHQQIFNSGGVDGEQITRRCVEGAPAHLRPGGRLYCTAQITARNEAVDQRVRQWIKEPDCDIAFYITKRHEIELFTAKATLVSKGNQLDFFHWMREFSQLGVRSLDYGLLIVERHSGSEPREPFTICRKTPEFWDPADFEASFWWEGERRSPGFESRFWQRKFRASSSLKLEVEHTLNGGEGWQIAHYRLVENGPFEARIQASQGLPHLLALMDGKRSVEVCFGEFMQSGVEIDRQQFADTVIGMVSEGFLQLA